MSAKEHCLERFVDRIPCRWLAEVDSVVQENNGWRQVQDRCRKTREFADRFELTTVVGFPFAAVGMISEFFLTG
jgi:hypothetical protein